MEAVEQPWFVPQKVLLLLKLKLQNNQDAVQSETAWQRMDSIRCAWKIPNVYNMLGSRVHSLNAPFKILSVKVHLKVQV